MKLVRGKHPKTAKERACYPKPVNSDKFHNSIQLTATIERDHYEFLKILCEYQRTEYTPSIQGTISNLIGALYQEDEKAFKNMVAVVKEWKRETRHDPIKYAEKNRQNTEERKKLILNTDYRL